MVISIIWTLFSLSGLRVERSARIKRHSAGQIFEERFEIHNRSRLGHLWIEVKDLSPLPRNRGSRVISQIGPKQYRSYTSRTLLLRRGAFPLGPTQLISGDPFGMFASEKSIPNNQQLVVLPFFVSLDHFANPAGNLPGGRALRRKSPEVTPYAAGVREYAPGDPLSRIHWKTTAHRDRIMVKEFEQDPQADIWILVDAQLGVNITDQVNQNQDIQDEFLVLPHKVNIPLEGSSFEYSVSVAASLANYYILRGRSVGFACAGSALTIIPAERGERQLGKILETLAYIQPEGKLPLMGLIEGQANQITRGSTVVLITALSSDSILVAVDSLLRRDLKPVVVLVDPSTFGQAK